MSPLLPAGLLLKWGNFPLSRSRITPGDLRPALLSCPETSPWGSLLAGGLLGTARLSPCHPPYPRQPMPSAGHGPFPQSPCPQACPSPAPWGFPSPLGSAGPAPARWQHGDRGDARVSPLGAGGSARGDGSTQPAPPTAGPSSGPALWSPALSPPS